jgi:hypothetical protein
MDGLPLARADRRSRERGGRPVQADVGVCEVLAAAESGPVTRGVVNDLHRDPQRCARAVEREPTPTPTLA